jgi:hypothetical protein
MRQLMIFFVLLTSLTADFSKAVSAAFAGQIVVTRGEPPLGKSDKDTIAQLKAAKLKEVTGESQNGETEWRFHYTAFLKQAGVGSLRLEFLDDAKARKPAASKSLDGLDPKSSVLKGEIAISGSDGLKKGRTYFIRLVNPQNKALASTSVRFK